jgi:hypothetical protein
MINDLSCVFHAFFALEGRFWVRKHASKNNYKRT